jgi:phospholipid/cholesterol/gamma-HCH transport system substrate-binding protein
METRARFVLLGFFTLGVILGGFGFVYWLNNAATLGQQSTYRIRFQDTVSGLRPGSAVLFNGIRVGEVRSLQLDQSNPRAVTAMISIERNTPVRADTQIEVYAQGLMGSPTISLLGRNPDAPAPRATGNEPPLLIADSAAGQDMLQAARGTLRQIDSVLVENAKPLRETIANLKTFTDALARNSDRIDSIAQGLERMVGSPAKASPTIYDLPAPTEFPPLDKSPSAQLIVMEPTAILLLDTQKVLVRSETGGNDSFPDSQWSDSLPKLFQARIVQGFENAKYGIVDRDVDGLGSKFRLLIDIRSVRLLASSAPIAEVEFGAKIVDADGKIVDARLFRATQSAEAISASAAAKAIAVAFGQAVTDLVGWTMTIVGA